MIDTETLILYGYVRASKYRTLTLNTLNIRTPKIPSEISEETGVIMNHTSNTLKQLQEHNLIHCINPDARKGRLYLLTSKGAQVQEMIKNKNNNTERYILTKNNSIKDTYDNMEYTTLKEIVELLNNKEVIET